MQPIALQHLELTRSVSELDPSQRAAFAFPVSSATGTASTAVVYFELEPGAHLGAHTDSAEELLLVLEGTAEAVVEGEPAILEAGSLAVVPATAPHDIRNVGDELLRVVGFFSSSTVVAIFERPEIEAELTIDVLPCDGQLHSQGCETGQS
jgi:quercetin dioxygenase-like cupin family protein